MMPQLLPQEERVDWSNQRARTNFGRLEHHGVAHDEGRDESGVCLIERVVEGAQAEHHAYD